MKKVSQNNDDDLEITKRLDAIIRLLIASLNSKDIYGMEQIYRMLNESGLPTGDIGKIVGKPSKTISGILINAKNYEKRKKGKKIELSE